MQKILSYFIFEYAPTQFAYSQTPGMKGKPVHSTFNSKRINAIATSTNVILKVHIKNITALVKGMEATIIQLCETFNNHFKTEDVKEELFGKS